MDKSINIKELYQPDQNEDGLNDNKSPEEKLSELESIRSTGEKLGLYKEFYHGEKQGFRRVLQVVERK